MAESIGTGITKGITTVNWNLTEEVRVAPMDKKLLSDYIDACELIRETEKQIRRKLFEGLTWEESKKSDLIKEG